MPAKPDRGEIVVPKVSVWILHRKQSKVSSFVLIAAEIKASGRTLSHVARLLSFECVGIPHIVQLQGITAFSYLMKGWEILTLQDCENTLENCMILVFWVFLFLCIFSGLSVGTDGQRQAIESTECSKNNQILHWLLCCWCCCSCARFWKVMLTIGGLIVDALFCWVLSPKRGKQVLLLSPENVNCLVACS